MHQNPSLPHDTSESDIDPRKSGSSITATKPKKRAVSRSAGNKVGGSSNIQNHRLSSAANNFQSGGSNSCYNTLQEELLKLINPDEGSDQRWQEEEEKEEAISKGIEDISKQTLLNYYPSSNNIGEKESAVSLFVLH